MDAIVGIILLLLFPTLIGVAFSLVAKGAKIAGRAVKKAVTGKETYFGPPQMKFVDEVNAGTGVTFKRVMFRGAIPNHGTMDVAYSLSLFDMSSGGDNLKFIISLVEAAQEADSVCYHQSGALGRVNAGSAMTDWMQVGAVFPEFIQPPFSGRRKIRVYFRLFDASNPPNIHAGFSDGGEIFHVSVLDFEYDFTDKGYEEATQDREEAQSLSLKIGIAVAMADGSLSDEEGGILKNWIKREVAPYSDEKQRRLKELLNNTLKEGYVQAKAGNLAISPLVERLSKIGEKKSKYDAIELCFDVMAADGAADPEEMALIRRVAEVLNLDFEEVEKMREKVTLTLSSSLTGEEGLESLVGIENNWSNEQKRKHLRNEFQKWSNRLNSLEEGSEREAAQSMLDNIASLRKKYG